jgi:SHS2 domain-containing protein
MPVSQPSGPSAAASPSHEFLEHTGEVHLHVAATSLAELLAESGRALAGLLLRGRSPSPVGRWEDVEVGSTDRTALLVDWLNELIYRADADREVPVEFELREAGESAVRGRIRGVQVQESPALVKAATLHGAKVETTARGVEGDVILDV